MNKKIFILFASTVAAFFLSFFLSCTNNNINYDGILKFSVDTLMFDTVFTTQGSSTHILKIYNTTDEIISIKQVGICGGQYSQFSINLNGSSGADFNDVEIMAHDSMYLFAKVRIDPTNINSPLVVEDSIYFIMKSHRYYVKMLAWGQDANYIIADTYKEGLPRYKIVAGENETTVWNSEKPYVVHGYAVVDSTGQLIIAEGVHVYFHSKSGLWVYKGGSVKVNGTLNNKVIFEGDRLEPQYDNVQGQWEKIWINEGSIDNEFNNVIIKNGVVGIHAQTISEPMGNSLILNNVEIYNMSSACLFTMAYSVYAGNCVFYSSRGQLAYLSLGGFYDFRHCTFANYYSHREDVSSIYLSNYYLSENNYYVGDMNAYFGNCIIYGGKKNEISKGIFEDIAFNCNFENSLLKANKSDFSSNYFTDCIFNTSPIFADTLHHNYKIDTIISPAVNSGKTSVVSTSPRINIINDITGKSRVSDLGPDMGAFEF